MKTGLNSILGANIRKRRKELGLTQIDLKKLTGISQGYISDLEKGKADNPTLDTLGSIAHALTTSIFELIKGDPEAEKRYIPQLSIDISKTQNKTHINFDEPELLEDYTDTNDTVKIPLVGKIHAGIPVEAIDNVSEFVDVPTREVNDGVYFYLIVNGDSMIGSRIYKGDRILVRRQANIENGDIAVVRVNNYEAALKRVKRIDGKYILYPDNPAYEPMIVNDTEAQIIGKVVKVEFRP